MKGLRVGMSGIPGAAALGFVLIAMVLLVVGCGSSGDTSASPSADGVITPGGVLKIGLVPGSGNLDPVLQPGIPGDTNLLWQIYEPLCRIGQDFSVVPGLAESWDSPDGKVWTFKLRSGVQFSNGQEFTSEDVLFSMTRLRDKESPNAMMYSIIEDVAAPDPLTVVFTLGAVNSEFPALLTDYRSVMLCKSATDLASKPVGTGPFMLESIAAEDRAVLVKNPNYWGKDADGNQLPYLDKIEYVYSPDTTTQIQGLQSGTLNLVFNIKAEQKAAIEADSNLKALSKVGNNLFLLQIRCDQTPGNDKRVRQALFLGTDRQALIDLVTPGVADPGNGTFVGPAYQDAYLDSSPYDPAKAKQLLVEAGYGDGLTIPVVVISTNPVPALVTAWQAQMADIGVDIEIQQVPPDVFYAEGGAETWAEAAFSVLDYGSRAVPVMYFKFALVTDAPWNYSRWSNAEFDRITKEITLENDAAKRNELYKEAQGIIQDEVPTLNFVVLTTVMGAAKNLEGVAINPIWSETTFETAYISQ